MTKTYNNRWTLTQPPRSAFMDIPVIPDLLIGQQFRRVSTVYEVLVTPELAHQLLALSSERQRKTSNRIAHKYGADVELGEFMSTHQSMAISTKGELEDGKHRCTAVVIADTPMWQQIQFDVDSATFDRIDDGHTRKSSQFLHYTNSGLVEAAAKIVAVRTKNTDARRIRNNYRAEDQSIQKTLDIVNEWPHLVTLARPVKSFQYVTNSFHLAVMALASNSPYADQVGPWLDGIKDGIFSSNTDPRYRLRERFIKDGKKLQHSHEGYILVVKAWNAFALGKEMKVLKVSSDEAVPCVAGTSW